MIWKQNKDIPGEYVEEISEKLNIDSLLARIYLNRNNNIEDLDIILNDTGRAILNPLDLVNAKEVADEISKYIANGDDIIIFNDYDSDGVNGGFLMFDVLNDVINIVGSESKLSIYQSERIYHYGLSHHFADYAIDYNNNTDKNLLVVTVDNGVAQIEQINKLINNGINVVVTDHHKSKKEVPNCLICNPHNKHVVQDESVYGHLCGTAVAFKIGQLVQQSFNFHDMSKYTVNVAIATVTDMMPMTKENMAFIMYGLDIINSDSCPVGILAMKEYLGIEKMTVTNIGYEIGPRLNSCGRLGKAYLAYELLATTDYDEAVDLAYEVENINTKRKELTDKLKLELKTMNTEDSRLPIIVFPEVPIGVVGILAGKAVKIFEKPCVVVCENADGILHGSGRSFNGLDMQAIFNIEQDKGNIINFGGHSEAIGVSFKKENLDKLINSINETINSISIEEEDEEEDKILKIDECISIDDINKDTFHLINEIPYGINFEKPIFALTDCKVIDSYPTKSNPDNLWLVLGQGRKGLKIWCPDMTVKYKELKSPEYIHLAGYIEKNFMSGHAPYTFSPIDIIPTE